MELFADHDHLVALFQVILIDLALAGDNAVVIGMAAAGLPAEMRRKAIIFGIVAATVMRIGMALATTTLLQVVGLLLAGGILLMWVAFKMWQELHDTRQAEAMAQEALQDADLNQDGSIGPIAKTKTMKQAIIQILIADVSMSLDNVLAVAGAAREHPAVLVFGLALSVALMGFAATFIANLLQKHRWIAYVGLVIIAYVAVKMVWEGGEEVFHRMAVFRGIAGHH